MSYDFAEIPETHLIIPTTNVYKYTQTSYDKNNMYGTSTILSGLRDSNKDVYDKLQEMIKTFCNNVRSYLYKALDDDEYIKSSYNYFDNYGKLSTQMLPWTVNEDTFRTLLPMYQELQTYIKDHYWEKLYDETYDEYYTEHNPDGCIPAIKKYLRNAFQYDDYIVNAWFSIIQIVKTPRQFSDSYYQIYNLSKKVIDAIQKKYTNNVSIDLFETHRENDIKYVVIPKDFYFYRGYEEHMFSTDMTWVGFDFMNVVSYATPSIKNSRATDSIDYCSRVGSVVEMRTKKPLKLIDLNDAQTVKAIMRRMDKKVRNAFLTDWKVVNDKVERQSNLKNDMISSKWICSNGYDGYIGIGNKMLHDEVMICMNNDTYLSFVDIIKTYDVRDMIPFCKAPYNQIVYDYITYHGYGLNL